MTTFAAAAAAVTFGKRYDLYMQLLALLDYQYGAVIFRKMTQGALLQSAVLIRVCLAALEASSGRLLLRGKSGHGSASAIRLLGRVLHRQSDDDDAVLLLSVNDRRDGTD